MKCPNCNNIISIPKQCTICQKSLCSPSCLESHFLIYHPNQQFQYIQKNTTPPKEQSPYILKGTLNLKIIYDETFSLKNFMEVYEEGKLKIVGSGSYGQVYLALNIINKKYYAIKHMDKKNLREVLHTFSGIYKEIDIQSRIDHPNIVKLLYVKDTEDSFDLVMDYAMNGNLFHYIRKAKGLSENKSFCLFIQVVNAVYFLHKNNLIHRDIKPENLLLFENNIVKLCDFGWCVKLNKGEQRGTFCGTTEYMSPELVNHKHYSKEIDVWSLGVLLYEMIHGYSPFKPNKEEWNEKDVMENIKNHNLNFGKKVSDECKELIYHLLDPNINNRYTVEDIFYSNFVKKYQKQNYCLPKNNMITTINNVNQSLNKNINENYNTHHFGLNRINSASNIDSNVFINYNLPVLKNINIINEQNDNIKNPINESSKNINNNLKIRNRSNSLSNEDNQKYYYNHIFDINNNYSTINNVNNYFNNIYSNNDKNMNTKNNEIISDEKLVSEINNKTANNFYPLNIQKNREQELVEIYNKQNEIKDPRNIFPDVYRDNKKYIDFNNENYNDIWLGTNEIIYENYYDPQNVNSENINYDYYYNFNNYNNNFSTNYYNGMNHIQNGTNSNNHTQNLKESLTTNNSTAVIINPKVNTENTTISTKKNLTNEKNKKLIKINDNNNNIVKINEFDIDEETNVLSSKDQSFNIKKSLKLDNSKYFVNEKKLNKKDFPNDSIKSISPKKINNNKNNTSSKQIKKNSPSVIENKKIKYNNLSHNSSNNNINIEVSKGEIIDNNNKTQNIVFNEINYLNQKKNKQSPKDANNGPKKLIKSNSCLEQIFPNNNQNYYINNNVNININNNNNNIVLSDKNNSYVILNTNEKKQNNPITKQKNQEFLNSIFDSIYSNKNRQRDENLINHSIRLRSKILLNQKEEKNKAKQKSNSFAIMENVQLNRNANNSIPVNYIKNVNNNNFSYMNNNSYNYINCSNNHSVLYINENKNNNNGINLNIYNTNINNSALNNNYKNVNTLLNANNNKNTYIQDVLHEFGKSFDNKKNEKPIITTSNFKRKKNVIRKNKSNDYIVNILSKSKSREKSINKISRVNNKSKILNLKDNNDSIINGNSDFLEVNDEKNATPKKQGDYIKVNPKKLLNSFISELNRYSNKERSHRSLRGCKMK